MKYKNFIIIFIAYSTLLFNSCKKTDINKTATEIKPYCSIKTSLDFGITSYYDYDSLIRIINYAGKKYSYAKGRVKIIENKVRPFLIYGEIILDSLGKALSRSYYYSCHIGEVWKEKNITSVYSYNPDNYLIKEVIKTDFETSEWQLAYRLTEEYNYEYENENLAIKNYTNSNGYDTTWNYTYTNLPNQLAELEEKLNFKGNQSKNLISTKEEITKSGHHLISTYSYTFDSKGKLESIAINNGIKTNFRKFVWNCQN